MNDNEILISVRNLEKKFNGVLALKSVSTDIKKGEVVVMIGPSGSGKSTFLRCLNCMEDPTGSSVIFNGVDIADPKVNINIHRLLFNGRSPQTERIPVVFAASRLQ